MLDAASTANKKGFRELIAQRNRITERSILGFVGRYLEESSCTLKLLDLSWNKIEQKGLDALFRALENNKSLEHLNIGSNHAVGKSLSTRLTAMLSKNVSLREFICTNNKLAGSGILGAMGKAMAVNKTLKIMDLSSNCLGHIDEQDLKLFCGILADETCTIEEIRLTDNALEPVFGAYLADALKTNTSVKTLQLGYNTLGGPVGSLPYGWKDMLSINSTMSTLDLAHNNFMVNGFSELFAAMAHNKGVRELVLDHNHMAQDGLSHVGQMFTSDVCNIQVLSLNNAKITDDLLIEHVLSSLKLSKSVEKVLLRNNDLTRMGVERVMEFMRQNPDGFVSLRELDLRDNENLFVFNEEADRLDLFEKFITETKLENVLL